MNVLICVKGMLIKDDLNSDDYVINPFDLFALMYLLERKDVFKLTITCLCMGPRRGEELLKYCYALGVDQTYLIHDNLFAGSDTYATSYIISMAIRKIGVFDAVICGCQSMDGETGQVPFGIAQHLGISSISGVMEIKQFDKTSIEVKRENGSYLETLKGTAPLLLVFKQFLIDRPILNFVKMKKARGHRVSILSNEELGIEADKCGLKGSLTGVLDTKKKFPSKQNIVLDDRPCIIAEKLMELIDVNKSEKV